MTDYLARNAVAIGDVRELAGRLEPQSVQTIVTSPPYFGLRDYGTATWKGGDAACDHALRRAETVAKQVASSGLDGGKKTVGFQQQGHGASCPRCGAARVDKQLGMEATPEEFVANLVAVFAALRPALKADGTLWLNLGDSFATSLSGKSADDPYRASILSGGLHNARAAKSASRQRTGRPQGVPPKSLLMIPHRVALALQQDGWIVRGDIVWEKPNPMPESVTDRPTRSHEYIFLIAKSPRYFYDQEAIRESWADERCGAPGGTKGAARNVGGRGDGLTRPPQTWVAPEGRGGRNKRDVWTVPPSQFLGAHFATFPLDLVRPCILAGTSAAGECSACGRAWARVLTPPRGGLTGAGWGDHRDDAIKGNAKPSGAMAWRTYRGPQHLGWAAQCSCPPGTPTRPQVVLDPFAGSCTTWEVAHEEGRDFIGIDLDERAVKWGADRLAKLPVGRLVGL